MSMNKDYRTIVRYLNSCRTKEHYLVCRRIVENFYRKYRSEVDWLNYARRLDEKLFHVNARTTSRKLSKRL